MNHSNKSITTSTPQSRSVYSRSKSIIQAPLLSFQSFSWWSVKIGLCLPWEWTTTWWSIPHDTPTRFWRACESGSAGGCTRVLGGRYSRSECATGTREKKGFEGAFAERKKRRLEPGRHVYATQLMPASKTNVPHSMLMVCRQLPSN